jgi:hypothetical protein
LLVPVTAKLSKAFYERLGEQVANELVEWFNSVDATYRSDLRELNELNFGRFDAKLEQRVVQLEARLGGLESTLNNRIDTLDRGLDSRFEVLESRLLGRLEQRLADVQTKLLRGMVVGWGVVLAAVLASLFVR